MFMNQINRRLQQAKGVGQAARGKPVYKGGASAPNPQGNNQTGSPMYKGGSPGDPFRGGATGPAGSSGRFNRDGRPAGAGLPIRQPGQQPGGGAPLMTMDMVRHPVTGQMVSRHQLYEESQAGLANRGSRQTGGLLGGGAGNRPQQPGQGQSGQLQLPEFGWSNNPQFQDILRQIMTAKANLEAELGQGRRRIEEDFARQNELLGQSRDQSLKNTAINFADRGLTHSGINIGEQAKVGEQFNEQVGELGNWKARTLEDIELAGAERQNQLQQTQASAEMERARAEQEMRMQEAMGMAQTQAQQQLQSQIDALIQGMITSQQPKSTPTGSYQPAQPATPQPSPQQQFQQQFANTSPLLQSLGIDFGTAVDRADLDRAFAAIGHNPGTTIDPADIQRLQAAVNSRAAANPRGRATPAPAPAPVAKKAATVKKATAPTSTTAKKATAAPAAVTRRVSGGTRNWR